MSSCIQLALFCSFNYQLIHDIINQRKRQVDLFYINNNFLCLIFENSSPNSHLESTISFSFHLSSIHPHTIKRSQICSFHKFLFFFYTIPTVAPHPYTHFLLLFPSLSASTPFFSLNCCLKQPPCFVLVLIPLYFFSFSSPFFFPFSICYTTDPLAQLRLFFLLYTLFFIKLPVSIHSFPLSMMSSFPLSPFLIQFFHPLFLCPIENPLFHHLVSKFVFQHLYITTTSGLECKRREDRHVCGLN